MFSPDGCDSLWQEQQENAPVMVFQGAEQGQVRVAGGVVSLRSS